MYTFSLGRRKLPVLGVECSDKARNCQEHINIAPATCLGILAGHMPHAEMAGECLISRPEVASSHLHERPQESAFKRAKAKQMQKKWTRGI